MENYFLHCDHTSTKLMSFFYLHAIRFLKGGLLKALKLNDGMSTLQKLWTVLRFSPRNTVGNIK